MPLRGINADSSGVNSASSRPIASRSRVIIALKAAICGGSGFIQQSSPFQDLAAKEGIRDLQQNKIDRNTHSLVELRPCPIPVGGSHPFDCKIEIGAPVQRPALCSRTKQPYPADTRPIRKEVDGCSYIPIDDFVGNGGPHGSIVAPLQLKAKGKLAKVPVCGVGSSLDRHEELSRGVISSAFVLNEE